MPTTDAATFCATIVDEWVRAGATDAFIAPGSRSTPLALSLLANDRMRVQVFHDERVASFAALGHGLATGRPGITLCTSGTAATHFHGAIAEADLSSVPLVVCTADRPPELWDIGAPQTIDQGRLFGTAVRFYAEPGVPDRAASPSWRSLGSRLIAEALGWSGRPGPVHANFSFRDPLVGKPDSLPSGREHGAPWHQSASATTQTTLTNAAVQELAGLVIDGDKIAAGVIIAGHGVDDPQAIAELATRLGWPILADHRSGCRSEGSIRYFDALLRSEKFVAETPVDVVLRFGEPLSSKVLGQWIAQSSADVMVFADNGRWSDPERAALAVVPASRVANDLLGAIETGPPAALCRGHWAEADRLAAIAVESTLSGRAAGPPSEIEIVIAIADSINPGGALVVSSSMPIRDLEWYGPHRSDIEVVANRGANGIDGVISTAIGIALSGRPTTVLIGDVAFLHDSTALIALRQRPIDLNIVVIDNDGGGIFSFLPQATALDKKTYETLFGTPHGTDLRALVQAHGLRVRSWPPGDDAVSPDQPFDPQVGTIVSIATSTRHDNLVVHNELNRSVVAAWEQRPTLRSYG